MKPIHGKDDGLAMQTANAGCSCLIWAIIILVVLIVVGMLAAS